VNSCLFNYAGGGPASTNYLINYPINRQIACVKGKQEGNPGLPTLVFFFFSSPPRTNVYFSARQKVPKIENPCGVSLERAARSGSDEGDIGKIGYGKGSSCFFWARPPANVLPGQNILGPAPRCLPVPMSTPLFLLNTPLLNTRPTHRRRTPTQKPPTATAHRTPGGAQADGAPRWAPRGAGRGPPGTPDPSPPASRPTRADGSLAVTAWRGREAFPYPVRIPPHGPRRSPAQGHPQRFRAAPPTGDSVRPSE